MGGDHRSEIAVHDLRGEQTFDRLAYHRIESVKCLVAEQIFCPRAQSEQDGDLLFHSF